MAKLFLLLALSVQLACLASAVSAHEFPLTHTTVVELSALKHLTKNLPIEIKCAAFKDKLREVAVMDDGALLRLTIEALEANRVPFRNNQYLLSDLKECKKRLGNTDELTGEALAWAKVREANREIEKLKEQLRLRSQSKEEREQPIESVEEALKLTYKLMGSEYAENMSGYQDRCYVYYILFGKQRPLTYTLIESAVNLRPGYKVFQGEVHMLGADKQALNDLATRTVRDTMDFANAANELGACLMDVKVSV